MLVCKIVLIIVKSNKDTEIPAIEDAFKRLTERNDVAILLINQHVRPLRPCVICQSPIIIPRSDCSSHQILLLLLYLSYVTVTTDRQRNPPRTPGLQ